ncbi:MAG: DUF302 domain-containing protein [Proteobacteria bacterium]|nr:DUF302 domain-containing protein [Pseudomonadota bacterium]
MGRPYPAFKEQIVSTQYGFSKTVNLPYEDAITAITDSLETQGFGILTTIDVKTTLRNKLDVDFRPYAILGACNPHLAHQALQAEEQIGLLLPCNVIVYDNLNGTSTVSVIDPGQMMSFTGNADLTPLANEATERLSNALAAIA